MRDFKINWMDFVSTISDWKFDLVYGSIGAGMSVIAQSVVKDVVHLWWVLIAAFLSPVAAYFGNRFLNYLKKKFKWE